MAVVTILSPMSFCSCRKHTRRCKFDRNPKMYMSIVAFLVECYFRSRVHRMHFLGTPKQKCALRSNAMYARKKTFLWIVNYIQRFLFTFVNELLSVYICTCWETILQHFQAKSLNIKFLINLFIRYMLHRQCGANNHCLHSESTDRIIFITQYSPSCWRCMFVARSKACGVWNDENFRY